jgi:hypothetical protein
MRIVDAVSPKLMSADATTMSAAVTKLAVAALKKNPNFS